MYKVLRTRGTPILDQSNDILLPQWTIPSFHSIAGRFPLGLEAVSLNILANRLAPGLPVLSRHPRYWSIYTYLIKYFQDTRTYTNKTTNAALGRYLKSREIVFGCAALMCPHHGHEPLRNVLGSDTFAPWLSNHKHLPTPVQLPTSLEGELGRYLQQSLGGYGQVYRGAMIDLELILPAEMNPEVKFDVVYGEVGAAVANTFGKAISHTRYVREYLDKDDIAIPLDVIEELGIASCFCQLRHHEAERTLLADVLLGRAQQDDTKTHAQDAAILEKRSQRAETVRMFLDLAEQTRDFKLDEKRFRDLLYFGDSGEIRWQPGQNVRRIWRQWWLIQLREEIVEALNNLFLDFIQWGVKEGGIYQPQNTEAYIHTVGALPLPALPDLPDTDLAHVTLGQLAHVLDRHYQHPSWASSGGAQPGESAAISERLLASSKPTPIASFLTLLLTQRRLTFIKQYGTFSEEEKTLLKEGGKYRLSTAYLFQWFDDHIKQDASAIEVFAQLIKEMIITQHTNVALEKLPFDTFRFYDDEGGIRFAPEQNVEMSSISVRFDAISEALYGLDLIQASLTKPSHAPTQYGWEVING